MSRTPRSQMWTRLLSAIALVLLLTLLVQTIAIEATPPEQTILGITETPTQTSTVTRETPTPTPTPTLTVTLVTQEVKRCKLLISCEPRGVAEAEGDEVEYVVVVRNDGNKAAVGVRVTVTVSEHFEIVEPVTTTQGKATIDGQVVTVDVGTMGPEPGFHVLIVVPCRVRPDPPAETAIENAAYIASDNCGSEGTVCGWVLPVTGTRGRPQRNLWIAAVGLAALLALGVWEGVRFRRKSRTS